MLSRSPHSFRQIADVLYQSLKQAFNEVCPKRYGAPLRITRVDESPSAPTISFQIAGAEQISLQIHLTVSHVGGNVYDITAQVEDGPERDFTYSEPDDSGSPLSMAPYLGKKIARHLLNDVEQQLGKTLLQNQVTSEA
jgi:hypothetical protein